MVEIYTGALSYSMLKLYCRRTRMPHKNIMVCQRKLLLKIIMRSQLLSHAFFGRLRDIFHYILKLLPSASFPGGGMKGVTL
jgi:hypothetical protein